MNASISERNNQVYTVSHFMQENALFSGRKKHSWQKKFTTTSHGGHDKFELCLNFYLMLDSRQV